MVYIALSSVDWAIETSNTRRKFCEVWTCGFWDMQAERQTERHKDCSTLHPSWGQSNIRHRASTSTRWHFAFWLCCHSNKICAPIANLPNSAPLGAPLSFPPTCIRVCAVVWECGNGQTDRHKRDWYTFRTLILFYCYFFSEKLNYWNPTSSTEIWFSQTTEG